MKQRLLFTFLLYFIFYYQIIAQVRKDVSTPKGSNVKAYETSEMTQADRLFWDAYHSSSGRTLIQYFSGEPSSSSRFNCHGYAWNMVEGGAIRWIGLTVPTDEDIYMTDGSYVQVCNEMYPGKVSWGSLDHSAITTSTPGRWISKFAYGPLVEHNWNDTPYGSSNLKYFVSTAISGSTTTLCSGTRTFSTVSISGATYTWTASSTLSIISGSGTNQITVQRNGSSQGDGWVQVVISTPCSSSSATRKTQNFAVGPANISNPNYWLFDEWSSMWQLSYTTAFGNTSTYSLVSGLATLAPNLNDCYVTTTTGAVISLVSTNQCGSSSPYYFYIPASGSQLTIYPNPVSETLTLELKNPEISENLPSQINLYSENHSDAVISIDVDKLYKKMGFTNGNKIEIDVSDLSKGLYYLHIVPKDQKTNKTQKMQIIIK